MRDMEFSPALATAHRTALGLSRVAAARAVGLSRQGLINIEDGESVPSVSTLARMATAYGREFDEFFIEPNGATSDDGRVLQPAEKGNQPDPLASRR